MPFRSTSFESTLGSRETSRTVGNPKPPRYRLEEREWRKDTALSVQMNEPGRQQNTDED